MTDDSNQQVLTGRLVATRWHRDGLRRGDTLYFLGKYGKIRHTGIYLGDQRYIEAVRPVVRYSSFDGVSQNTVSGGIGRFVLGNGWWSRSVVANDREKCLMQLEGHDWGPPVYESHLVRRIHELRHKPIAEFSVEDLRITIGQNVGLRHLLPIAIELLDKKPLAEGDFYPGDLLCCVLRCEPLYWKANLEQRQRVIDIAECALRQLEASDEATEAEHETLRRAVADFRIR